MMNPTKNQEYVDKLRRRRNEIMRTLEHVQTEQRAVDENKDWIDHAAYVSRCHLLDSLADWYTNETARVDDALNRLREGRYGVCLGCRVPIEPHRLETTPEAAFCAECQRTREALAGAENEL
jgi:RNA polymerase-binding transcription factor